MNLNKNTQNKQFLETTVSGISHHTDIIKAYGIYYEEMKPYIDEKGYCPMSVNYYMDMYKKINQHKWYPNPNSKPFDVFSITKIDSHFRPKCLDL
jgi:hypothetical protein